MRGILKNLLVLAVFTAVSGLVVSYQPGVIFGLIFLLFFIYYFADKAYRILVRAFNLPEHSFLQKFFGFLFVSWLILIVCGFMVIFGATPEFLGTFVLPITGALIYILPKLVFWQKETSALAQTEIAESEEFVLPSSTSLLGGAVILLTAGFYVLYKHQTGDEILTPWSVLPNYYIYLYLLIYLFLGFLIFTNSHAKTILILLTLFCALCHFNLALTHDLVYGADYWRHLGVENQLVQTGKIAIENFADNPNFFEKLNPGVYSYAQFWGGNVFLHLLTGASLLSLGRFAGPILWALFIPTLLYAFARLLFFNKRMSLFLSWASFVPSALLVTGSFSLPVSLHFIFWLFALLLLLKADLQNNKRQLWGLVFIGLLLSFGYLLYAILFFLALFLKLINIYLKENNWQTKASWFIVLVFSFLALPIAEVIAGYSQLSLKSDLLSAFKQFVGNLTGYYFVSGPRPHTIDKGNILFYQTPDYAFISNALTVMPWWMLLIAVVFIFGATVGAYKFFKNEISNRWLMIFFGGLFGGYFISRYLLNGENILTRRLDAILALGLIIFFVYWLKDYMQGSYDYKMTVASVLVLAVFGSAIYSLGPVSRAVGVQEYLDFKDIAGQLQSETKYCVIADPYNLTALEGVSAKQIVGGGFPINGDFSQTELQAVLKDWEEGRNKEMIIREAKQVTGAKNCFVLLKNGESIKMEKY